MRFLKDMDILPRHSTLVLASNSPRRQELLAKLGVSFSVEPADIDESVKPGESPRAYVSRVAREKALAVANRLGRPAEGRFLSVPLVRGAPATGEEALSQAGRAFLVLAADTAVVLGDEIMGKPKDARDAERMLLALSGRTHAVLTGVVLAGAFSGERVVETKVRMRVLTSAEVRWYISLGECFDKAGAYGLQGAGAFLVESIEGSPTNVIGLPLAETMELLVRAGIRLPWSVP